VGGNPVVAPPTRSDFLKAGGVLLIGFTMTGSAVAQTAAVQTAGSPVGPPNPALVDSWIAVHSDNTATVIFGKAELGQGSTTGVLQIVGEELDLGMDQLSAARLDTNVSPDQGNTISSLTIAKHGPQIRAAAAEARQALLLLAASKLGVPASDLVVSKGVVSALNQPSNSVTYGELLGEKHFNVTITGKAPQKSAAGYKLVGTRVPRIDIPDKVSSKHTYVHQVHVANMLHGRIVRPRGQGGYGLGTHVVSIDETSIAAIPGARVVRRADFIGVVAPKEWDAVRAAKLLRVRWESTPALHANDTLHDAMRSERTNDKRLLDTGDVKAALSNAAHVASATFKAPYQSHAPFSPNCAVADVRADSAVVMCSTQGMYYTRAMVATVLNMPPERVRVQFYEGAGTFGHSCYDDAVQAAAIMSQLAGAPVRVQFMRWDEFGWDNYGPAHLADVSAGVDADGKIVAFQYDAWQHGWQLTETSEELSLGRKISGWWETTATILNANNAASMYAIPNMRLVTHQIPSTTSFLKGSYFRSPLDVAISFAAEQTLDELAHKAKIDPVAFRRKNITDPRWNGVLTAVAQASRWTPRISASQLSNATVVTGRGVALGTHYTSYGAAVADIEVNKSTGVVRVKHLYGVIDAGLVVNPALVENQIIGQMTQATSRMLKEEVTFSPTNVTSLDWQSYPILRFGEHPEVTPIVISHPELPSSGAGEESLAAGAAAIANAFFDATGVRMRRYPLTPERVLAALL
jgi:nicotinate dehydrogenase subunit B